MSTRPNFGIPSLFVCAHIKSKTPLHNSAIQVQVQKALWDCVELNSNSSPRLLWLRHVNWWFSLPRRKFHVNWVSMRPTKSEIVIVPNKRWGGVTLTKLEQPRHEQRDHSMATLFSMRAISRKVNIHFQYIHYHLESSICYWQLEKHYGDGKVFGI